MAKNQEIQIEEHTCASEGCGVTFWVSEAFGGRRRADKKNFYCPNGHSLSYGGDTEVQRLKRLVDEKNNSIFDLEKQLKKKTRKPRKK